ncbi:MULTISPECIES: MarR family transcriptional regulator [Streptomyces]|uniref:MarR family transcriptional regulator n=1 Tax=Streptomyces odorifer TaxID=53450 RepID=A0A7Y6F390_9ACTN|nr:MarR family transcriptional regulator [Streptomyces odorifer]MBZ2410824.1 MarR family transcriptional regulator [Streptomyces sp. L06]NUV30779.1 MarR family transcriptional regulator [Streptomyces odorifer]NUV38094.1 MarR family transcriptional regulator [Streptomyces sp. KAI-27]NUV45668.1 MarR family transcriptional regulator [Streptomyces sp. CAI-78]
MSGHTLKWAATNADSLLADLDLPVAAYRALLKLRGKAKAGGQIEMDQGSLGTLLDLSRPSVNAALRRLELARLVKKVRNGVYQINPMLAGYEHPEDAEAAVRAMDRADRLDDKRYFERYYEALAAYEDQLAAQRKKKADAAAAKKAAASRRRGALHAVG